MINKTILVTGATSGIGETSARYFNSLGMNLYLTGRNQKKLDDMKLEMGGNVYTFSCDLNNLENVELLFNDINEKNIKFDGLLFSSGIADPTPIRANTIEYMHKMMNVNCLSFMEIGKFFCNRRFSNNGASIVAISSLAADYPSSGQGMYAATKEALNSMVQVMAKEYTKREIRVNSIMPSYVLTPMVQGEVSYAMNNGIENLPFGPIDPIQIAYLAEFLLSDKSKYITGARIPVSAGL